MNENINTHVVLVSALVKKGDRYLMGLRSGSDPQAPGTWSFIGGKVDTEVGDKVIENTLRREILEETGITIKEHMRFLASNAFIRNTGDHTVSIIFLVEYESGDAKPLDGQEEVEWFTLEEILRMIESDKRISYQKTAVLRAKELSL